MGSGSCLWRAIVRMSGGVGTQSCFVWGTRCDQAARVRICLRIGIAICVAGGARARGWPKSGCRLSRQRKGLGPARTGTGRGGGMPKSLKLPTAIHHTKTKHQQAVVRECCFSHRTAQESVWLELIAVRKVQASASRAPDIHQSCSFTPP